VQPATGTWWRILIWVAIVLATLGFLYAVRSILLPFALAFIITVLLEPSIQKLRRKGVSRKAAVSAVMLVFFGIVTGVLIFAVPAVSRQIQGFSANLQSMTNQLGASTDQTVFTRWNPVIRATPAKPNPVDQILEQFQSPLERFGLPTTRRSMVQQYVEPHRAKISKSVQTFFNGFLGIVLSAGSQFFLLLFTPIFVALMLSDFERLKVRSATWIPTSIRAETISLFRDVGQVFISYLRGVTTSVAVYTLLMATLFLILGVQYAILVALLVGAVYMIPYLGYIISAVTLLCITGLSGQTGNGLLHFGSSWSFASAVVAIYTVVFFVYDNFVNPQFMGRAVGLNLLVSMFVVFSGGALFGIVGMIIAYPTAGAIRVILERLIRSATSTTTTGIELPPIPLRHRPTVST